MSCTDHLLELESLRLQVADLKRTLAEREQMLSGQPRKLDEIRQDVRERSHRLHAIVEGTAAETGEEFLASFVNHLTSALDMQYAVIGEVSEGLPKKIRTLAVSARGTLVDNFEYELAHTPCATVLTETFVCFDRDVQGAFPRFQRLADLGVESYCAVPLQAKSGATIGLLVVMDTKPLQQGDDLQSLLGVLAPRVAAEFERRRAEQERVQALADLHNVMETVPDILFTLDTQGNMVRWNRRVVEVTGYSSEELLNKPALAFVPPEEQARTTEAIQRAFTEGYAELEGLLLTKDLRIIPYHWTGALLKNTHGDPIGITGVGRDVSEKKRAEEKLHKAELHYRTIFEQAGVGVAQIDSITGRFVQVNRKYCEILGLTGAERLATDFIGITPPDDLVAELENMKRLCSGEIRSFTMEKRYVRKNGSIVWVTLNAAPLWRPGEEPVHHIAVVQDITQRKRTEQALRDREAAQARFKSTLDQTHDSVFMFDPDSLRFHYCNQGAVEQVGYSEAELLTMTPLDIKPEFTEQSFCEMLQLLRDGRVASHVYETVHRHKDGHDVAVEVSLQLVRQEGREGCFVAVVRDITDRRQAEEALRASEARFRMLVEATTDWMWEIDEHGRYTYCSPKIRDLLGYEPAEALGKTPFDFMPEEEARRIAGLFGPIAAARQPFSGLENMNRRKDGRLVILECRGVPIIDAGVFRGYRGFDQDITERKRAEEALICSERQLRTVLDALPVGVWFTDQLGKPVLSNPAAKQIWSGIKQVGIKTAPNDAGWWEATGPSEAIHRWALSQSLTKGLSSLNETIDLEGFDGRIKTIRNATVPVQDETGVILGAIVLNEDVTALRQMQGALKLTQSSVDHAVEGFLWVDSDARILNVNDAACRMLEYSRDELTTMTMHDIDPNVSRDLWSSYWDELKRKGSMTFESKHWSKTGRVLDTEVTVTCLEYEGKQYSCAIMRDIGERKRAETSLRQSEERYRSLVDSAPIGIFVNEDGRFAYANREMQRILNATNVEQLIGTPVLDRIAPEFQQIVKDRIHAMMSNGQPLPSLDEQFVRLDGSRVDVAVTAIPTSFNGMPVMQVLVLDITERKQAEAAIRRSHAFLRQVIDIYPNFIFAKDRAGQFRLANQAVADAYGITVDQLIGKTDADFNPNPIEVEFFRLKDLEVMDSLQERVISEEAITDSAGRTRWLQTVKRPICDEEGRAIMILGAATDITERKRMEETLRQREQDLRAAIEERERISQDLHDGILQSLFAVGLALESAKSRMPPRTRKTAGLPLDQAIDQLNRVMHEIRNFIAGLGSDLLKGKDLPAALQQMLDSLTQPHATRVRLAVEGRAAQGLSAEQSIHIFLVIQEAVSNCIRHGRAQEATVSLKMLKQGVRLSIRDNGSGFNPEVARRSGHGLTNMAARAQKIGGRFTVSSKINEGTRVVVDFPKEVALDLR